MTRLTKATAFALVLIAHGASQAAEGATAPFNEAVRTVNGKRVVEVAPFPAHMKHNIGTLKKPIEYPYQVPVSTIETSDGLMDCYSTLWYHPTMCNRSTFGTEVRFRTWIVLMGGKWFHCASHLSAKSCTPILIDGTLRPIPRAME